MAQYQAGTVNVSNGSPVVVGAGATSWTSQVSVGDLFAVNNEFVWYYIQSVDTDNQITLTSNYTGTTKTAQQYAIQRDFTPNNNFPIPSYGDIGVSTLISKTLLEIDATLTSISPLSATMDGNIVVSGTIALTSMSLDLGTLPLTNALSVASGGTGASSFRTPVADAAYTVLVGDRVVAITALTAARTITLPPAASFPPGFPLYVVDEYGNCSPTKSITIAAAAGDSIQGQASLKLTSAGGYAELYSNGTYTWHVRRRSPNLITLTTSQNYVPTPGMQLIFAQALPAGGGGGSGALQTSGLYASGGAGGGGGGVEEKWFTAAQIGSSQFVTIGAPGKGGAAVSGASPLAGNSGSVGGSTMLGNGLLRAYGGAGGGGGQLVSNSGGGGGGGLNQPTSGVGSKAGTSATPTHGGRGATGIAGAIGASGESVSTGATGGASGGGIDATPTAYAGGASIPSTLYLLLGALAGASGNAGASSISGNGLAGSAGSGYGAGGSAGGAALVGNSSGAGADGTQGVLSILEFF